MHIDELLTTAVKAGASALHLKVGNFPILRVRGTLVHLTDTHRLEEADLKEMAATVTKPDHREKFAETQEVDVAYSACPVSAAFAATYFSNAGRSRWSFASSRYACRRWTS